MAKRRTDAGIAAQSLAAVDEAIAHFTSLPALPPSYRCDLAAEPLIAKLAAKYASRQAKSNKDLIGDAADLVSWLAEAGERLLGNGLPLPAYAIIIALREKAEGRPSILDNTDSPNPFKATAHKWIRARAQAVATLGCGVLKARPSDCSSAITIELRAANYRPASGADEVKATSVARWLWPTSPSKAEAELRRDAILDYAISYGWRDERWDASEFRAKTSLKELSASLRVLCNSLAPVNEHQS